MCSFTDFVLAGGEAICSGRFYSDAPTSSAVSFCSIRESGTQCLRLNEQISPECPGLRQKFTLNHDNLCPLDEALIWSSKCTFTVLYYFGYAINTIGSWFGWELKLAAGQKQQKSSHKTLKKGIEMQENL